MTRNTRAAIAQHTRPGPYLWTWRNVLCIPALCAR